MKKSKLLLAALAIKFRKYAQSQSLQEIITNAAGYGEQSANGIMNFPAQLKQDDADMNINVTISGNSIGVSQPSVVPVEYAPKYARLPEQIQKYLERHVRDFPLPQGTTTLQFSGANNVPGIATNK